MAKRFDPMGCHAATLIPPAFGMASVNLHTWGGGWGTVTYWNAFVGNLELQGAGNVLRRAPERSRQIPGCCSRRFWEQAKRE